MSNLTLHSPWWLLAVFLLPFAAWLRGRRGVDVLLVPFAAAWHRPSLASVSRWPATLAVLGLLLLIGALARPQRVEDRREVRSEGYDIMLAIDLSGSMLAEDYETSSGGLLSGQRERINRLQAIKPVIQAFIERRPTDRIGVVLFAGRAYTMAPLTFDHAWLGRQLERVKIGLIEDGTAIGDGLGLALTRLEQATRQEGGRRQGAFVVLMTDGANNRGALTPQQAADLAKSRHIAVYTIGAGKDGYVPFPYLGADGRKHYTMRLSDLDEGALRDIARQTGGQFFRAADTGTIESAFRAIDRAQKIEFQAKSHLVTTELFPWLAVPGLAFLTLAGLLARRPGGRAAASLAQTAATPPALPRALGARTT